MNCSHCHITMFVFYAGPLTHWWCPCCQRKKKMSRKFCPDCSREMINLGNHKWSCPDCKLKVYDTIFTPFWKAIGVMILIALALVIPPSRVLILWLLPLGSGVDDLIVTALLVLVLLFLFVRYWSTLPKWWQRVEKFFKE